MFFGLAGVFHSRICVGTPFVYLDVVVAEHRLLRLSNRAGPTARRP